MEYILETKNLTKRYKDTTALKKVNLKLEKGHIYGLIGKNGAGKSTFIRIITGLSFKSDGEIKLFGKSDEGELENLRKRIGCMVDGPALYPNMTAYENLNIQCIQRGIPGKKVISDTLKLIGLEDTKKKKVKDFSLGMKQRLGIGLAIISDPEFLILDEPINGLDPVGIMEIRELMKKLNKEKNMTILISSHILEELYETADNFIIISDGEILENLTRRELDEKCKKHILLKVNNVEKAVAVIEEKLQTYNYKVMPDNSICLYDYIDDVNSVSKALTAERICILEITTKGDSLQNYFINKIGGTIHD